MIITALKFIGLTMTAIIVADGIMLCHFGVSSGFADALITLVTGK